MKISTRNFNDAPVASLIYNGQLIRDRNEMLSLTDMWRAAGGPEEARPAEWLRHDGTKQFIECVSSALNMGESHILSSVRGRNGATYAHWQIGLAYAKYLSPEFHMWCNEVVRERFDGNQSVIPQQVLETLERSFGIMRMLAHKVTELEKMVASSHLVDEKTIDSRVQAVLSERTTLLRRGETAGQTWSRAGLPPLKNAATWLGNRLAEMDCMIDSGKGELGGRTARLFDPDKAAVCMRNGLKLKAKRYIEERQGQGKLRLIQGGGK
jgi:hypothetical protein